MPLAEQRQVTIAVSSCEYNIFLPAHAL